MLQAESKQYGVFLGVFTPAIVAILGMMMFLRFGWVVGNAGLYGAIAVVMLAYAIILVTALSVASLTTSQRSRTGGAYFLISRALGLEVGGAIGFPLFLSQAVSLTLYCFGLAEVIGCLFGFENQIFEAFLALVAIAGCVLWAHKCRSMLAQLQAVILVAVTLSIGGLLTGAEWELLIKVPEFSFSEADGGQFWVVFAVFFPAVTGVLSGLSLSEAELLSENDTSVAMLWAIAIGFVVYVALAIALAHHQSPDALQTNPLVWASISWAGGWLLWPALLASILLGAVASVQTAPRTLQALADDEVLPSLIGTTSHGEPRLAVYITGGVAMCAVLLGDLNAVAKLASVFFLATFGMVNVVNMLEEISANPSFRPRMRLRWYWSFVAALACFVIMLLINPWLSILAFIAEGFIYYVLSRRVMETTWGDMRAGVLLSLMRWSLIRLRNMENHSRNWRPNILVFSENVEKDVRHIQLASFFSQGRGFTTVVGLRTGENDDFRSIDEESKANSAYLRKKGIRAFCEIDVVNNIPEGMVAVAQANGFAGLQSNTVMFGWPEQREFSFDLTRSMRKLDRLGKSFIVVRLQEEFKREKRRIDVWWAGAYENGDLMLMLAYLLNVNHEWSESRIMLKTIVSDTNEIEEREDTLARLCEHTRIEATPQVVIQEPGDLVADIIRQHSVGADMVLCGLGLPEDGKEEEFVKYISTMYAGIPNLMLVRNAGIFRGILMAPET